MESEQAKIKDNEKRISHLLLGKQRVLDIERQDQLLEVTIPGISLKSGHRYFKISVQKLPGHNENNVNWSAKKDVQKTFN